MILQIILLILDLFTIYLLIKEIKLRKFNNIKFNKTIKNDNKILFYKLQKQYLNNVSSEDIDDLIIFLNNYKKERFKK